MTAQITLGGIHLLNSAGAPSAGGVATATATTPFSIRKGWTLGHAPAAPIFSGGAPFRIGSSLAYIGYDNVVEQIPIAVEGSSHENAVARLQELKRALDTTLFSTAPLMSVLPTSSSTIMYCEILFGDVREVIEDESSFEAWEAFGTTIYAEVMIYRGPFFSPATLTTLINAATFTNTGTGGNNNTQSLGSPAGDLIYEGSPLNIKIVPTVSDDIRVMFLSTVYQRTYTASVASPTTTTISSIFRDTTVGITDAARTRNGLKLRVLFHITNSTSAQVQLQAYLISRVTNNIFWRGPLYEPGGVAGDQLLDLTPQGVSLDFIRQATLTSGDVDVGVFLVSKNGSSVGVTTASQETLLYYTFCRVDAQATVANPHDLRIEAAQNLNGTAYVPTPPHAFATNVSGGTTYLNSMADVRGELPRAISGSSLYMGWNGSNGTSTAVVTVTHLPLYRSLRGSG